MFNDLLNTAEKIQEDDTRYVDPKGLTGKFAYETAIKQKLSIRSTATYLVRCQNVVRELITDHIEEFDLHEEFRLHKKMVRANFKKAKLAKLAKSNKQTRGKYV